MLDLPSEKFIDLDNQNKLEFEENTCMYCGKKCDNVELLYTGDDESFEGFEVWCWCEECQVDTFHKIREKK